MRILRTLIWKELSEQAWKLAFGCVLLTGFAAVALLTRVAQDATAVSVTLLLGTFVLPILTATGVLAREQEEGDLHSLLALPVRPSVVFAVKTGVGLATCALPLAAAALAVLVLAGDREVPGAVLVAQYSSSTVTAMALFIWTASLGVLFRTQATVGLVGFLVVAFSFALSGVFTNEVTAITQWTPVGPFFHAIVLHRYHGDPDRWITASFAQLPLCGLVWASAVRRLSATSLLRTS